MPWNLRSRRGRALWREDGKGPSGKSGQLAREPEQPKKQQPKKLSGARFGSVSPRGGQAQRGTKPRTPEEPKAEAAKATATVTEMVGVGKERLGGMATEGASRPKIRRATTAIQAGIRGRVGVPGGKS